MKLTIKQAFYLTRGIAVFALVSGFIMIGMTTSWGVAVGVFLMMAGNNIERSNPY